MKKLIIFLLVFAAVISGLVLASGVYMVTDERMDSSDPNLFISLGNFLMKQGMTGHAVLAYQRAVELDEENFKALNNLGVYYLDIDEKRAEEYFLLSLEKNPSYEMARKNLAVLYNRNGHYRDAADNLRVLVEAFPDNVNYNYDLGINLAQDYYHNTKDPAELESALKYFQKVDSLEPGFEKVRENIEVIRQVKELSMQ